jgi:hypothetical protein
MGASAKVRCSEHTGLPMPKYFFHVRDHGELVRDPDGLDLPALDAVAEECRNMVREVLGEEEWRDELTADRAFEIVDELGRVVLIVPFRPS